jgi:cell wall-associated NlpC family hydrolase
VRRHLYDKFALPSYILILGALFFILAGDALALAGIIFQPKADTIYAPANKAVVSRNTTVAVNTDIKNAMIFYTTDGSAPTASSTRYTGPIRITRDTTIRAMAFRDGIGMNPISTMNYIVYSSAYDISPVISDASLSMDFVQRDDSLETSPARKDWYRKKLFPVQNSSWGPKAKQYPEVANYRLRDPEWLRKRIIAVAARYINTQFQHHNLIAWAPPQSWPMNPVLPVRLGHQSQGTDSSNFTSWVYNFGLGIEFTGYIEKQSRMTSVKMPDGSSSKVKAVTGRLFRPDFKKLISRLKMGDLIYISSGKGRQTADHVVIWIGNDQKTGEWLVIDSLDQVFNSKDSTGSYIPSGVQIRAFRENSWYYEGFVTALRIIKD